MRFSNRARRVTSFVTKGLPSRSPPIQEPNWTATPSSRTTSRVEGVAVPVAADPGTELEERRHLPALRRVRLPQRALQLVHQLGDDLEEVLVDEVQPPRQLLVDGGFLEPQLAGEPQQ